MFPLVVPHFLELLLIKKTDDTQIVRKKKLPFGSLIWLLDPPIFYLHIDSRFYQHRPDPSGQEEADPTENFKYFPVNPLSVIFLTFWSTMCVERPWHAFKFHLFLEPKIYIQNLSSGLECSVLPQKCSFIIMLYCRRFLSVANFLFCNRLFSYLTFF